MQGKETFYLTPVSPNTQSDSDHCTDTYQCFPYRHLGREAKERRGKVKKRNKYILGRFCLPNVLTAMSSITVHINLKLIIIEITKHKNDYKSAFKEAVETLHVWNFHMYLVAAQVPLCSYDFPLPAAPFRGHHSISHASISPYHQHPHLSHHQHQWPPSLHP